MGELSVYSLFFGTLLFLFPVFVYVDGYVDVRENKCWFSISLFKYLKIKGGYAQLEQDGVAIHLTKKKAVFVPYSKMTDTRKKFEITQGFQLWRFHQVVETGGADKVYGIFLAAALQAAGSGIFSVLQTKYPFLSLNNGILLTEKACLKVSLQTVTIFNGLVITIAIVKKILEALINWIRIKKLTAFSKKRRKSLQGS